MFNKNRKKIEIARDALVYEIQSLETRMDITKSAVDSLKSKGELTIESFELLAHEHHILYDSQRTLKEIVDLLD